MGLRRSTQPGLVLRSRTLSAVAGTTARQQGRAADCGRRDGNPLRRGREKDRSCRRKKRAGLCRNADRRMRKTQAGRLAGESNPVMHTQVGRSGDPAIRRSGDPAIRRSGDPAIRRSGIIVPTNRQSVAACQARRENPLHAHGDGAKRGADCHQSFSYRGHRSSPCLLLRARHDFRAPAGDCLYSCLKNYGEGGKKSMWKWSRRNLIARPGLMGNSGRWPTAPGWRGSE